MDSYFEMLGSCLGGFPRKQTLRLGLIVHHLFGRFRVTGRGVGKVVTEWQAANTV